MESTTENRLCDICATIPFLELHAKAQERDKLLRDKKSISWSFGNVSDVRRREYCPFCRLVYEGIMRNVPDDSDVDIVWEQYERDTFSCPLVSPLGTKITFIDIEHRFLDKRIDIFRVRQWLRVCSERHSNCLPHQSTPEVEIPNFRVIDVPRRCIVTMPNSNRYVALSYVWGQVDTYRLVKGNLKGLMKFDGLTRIWENLPRTIRDVILFTEAIGERYLWVDTLCLIQDDDNDKIPGIKYMDVIFSRAFCTIVAASGEDANSGIPGWGIIRRRAQRVSEVLPGINAILTQSMTTYLRQTRYDKRAWTFQEYFLSPRRIIFVNSQAYYLCRECYWREEDAEIRDLNDNIYGDESIMSLLDVFWMRDQIDTHEMLTMMLYHYTTRQLTYASDILNAMDGICRALSIRCKCSFFQGMPVAALDLYLVFHTLRVADRRRGFPSYSWAGWQGQIFFEQFSESVEDSAKEKNNWLSNCTWIVWYRLEPSTGTVSHLWDIDQNSSLLGATEHDIGYRQRRTFRIRRAASRLLRNDATTEPSPLHHDIHQAQYSYPLLQFWTVSLYFNVSESEEQNLTKVKCLVLDLFDRTGSYCGFVYKNRASTDDIRTDHSGPIELILLSECWKSVDDERKCLAEEIIKHVGSNFTNEVYYKDFERGRTFWALWIEWNSGVAERVGIAEIFQAAMEESLEPGPIWKEILLG